MTRVPKDYILLLFIGLSLTSCSSFDHRVRYRGSNEVWEGDPFEVSCVIGYSDLEGWTVNSSLVISEDNDLGYILSKRDLDTFREELILQVQSAQLFHEGEYRCNRYSRDYHYIRIIPASAEAQENGNIKGEVSTQRATNEYVLEINKTIEFYCSSAKDDNTPVTWYKNSRRIVENSESNILIAGLILIIENAQEDDAGEYMCTVDTPYVTGYTDIGRLFRLNSPAKIMDFPEKENIIKGRSLNLHCKAQGFPLPKIVWYIGNMPASDLKETDLRISIYSADGGMSNSYLIFRDMTPSDRGLYTCRAENSIDSGMTMNYDEESVFVHVRENMIETNEDVPGMGKVLTPGESLVLQCNTSECPHCTVVWFKDGNRLHSIPDHLEIHEKNNSVTIEHSSYDDAGVYVCAIDRKQLDVALNATIVVQSKIKLEKFDASSVVVEGSPLEIYCNAKGAPTPFIKWFIGEQEIYDDDKRVKLEEHDGLKRGKFLIDEADFDDRNHYTCEAYNQLDSVNTTVFIRVKGKLAALWPFLGICAEVAILCSIIFVYERRKSMNQCDEPETDLPADNKHRDQKGTGKDVRQRK